jgi:hypothetical protein
MIIYVLSRVTTSSAPQHAEEMVHSRPDELEGSLTSWFVRSSVSRRVVTPYCKGLLVSFQLYCGCHDATASE